MTNETQGEKSQIHFIELPFDPDSTGKADPEKRLKIREAEQAHRFRDESFLWMKLYCSVAFCLWVGLLISIWPDPDSSTAAVIFLGAKLTISTVVLITIAISILRFASQCAHHDKHPKKDEIPNPNNIWESLGKIILRIFKSTPTN